MRKRHLFWIIPCSLIAAFIVIWAVCFFTSPVKFKKVYFDNKHAKLFITEKELESDLNLMKYLFQYAYVGYNEAVEKGFDIDATIDELRTVCKKELKPSDKTLDSKIFAQKTYEILTKHMTLEDKHISMWGLNYSHGNYKLHAFYSNVYLEEKSDGFYVYKSEVDKVPVGTKFTGNKANLIEWYDGIKKSFRFGVVTKKVPNVLMFISGDEKIPVPVLKEEDWSGKSNWVNVRTTDDTVYISVSDFGLLSCSSSTAGFSKKFLNEFYSKIREAAKSRKTIILDLRNNGGGNGMICSQLISAILYYNTEDSKDIQEIINNLIWENEKRVESPVMAQLFAKWNTFNDKEIKKIKKQRKENPDVEYYEIEETEVDKIYSKNEFRVFVKNLCRPYYKLASSYVHKKVDLSELPAVDFDGDLYVLINSNSASASEYTIAEACMLEKHSGKFNLHLIGENSCGAVSYFNPNVFYLKNSGIGFYIPTAYTLADAFKNDSRYHGEAQGWFPETWTTNENLLNTLVNLTGDKQLETELNGLEKCQL